MTTAVRRSPIGAGGHMGLYRVVGNGWSGSYSYPTTQSDT
jgi:hypothetical protein